MYDDEELARLLTEARKENKTALGTLLAQLRPWVRWQAEGLLGQRLRARIDGSDIAHDVHIRAFERFDQFRGESVPELRAWIKTILRRMLADRNRDPKALGEEGDNRLPDVPATGTTPSQGAMRIENQARLIEALQWLPEKYRLVLQLRFFDGLPFEDVAQRIGVTVGNARVLMVRAIKRLRNELGDENA
ncbi:MAG TPA: sigma-70 family RNA polymerase sigma factor [Gemmataceae bacterium]|nr:sigma-70 family RNA polymerase sigma factor [Gemmataceae bacterium]